MVHQDMAVDQELVHNDIDSDTANALHDDLGGFANIDDLEDFLRNFSDGEEDTATLETQGNDDIGGEPVTTVH